MNYSLKHNLENIKEIMDDLNQLKNLIDRRANVISDAITDLQQINNNGNNDDVILNYQILFDEIKHLYENIKVIIEKYKKK